VHVIVVSDSRERQHVATRRRVVSFLQYVVCELKVLVI
jgi:hypothetical protein